MVWFGVADAFGGYLSGKLSNLIQKKIAILSIWIFGIITWFISFYTFYYSKFGILWEITGISWGIWDGFVNIILISICVFLNSLILLKGKDNLLQFLI